MADSVSLEVDQLTDSLSIARGPEDVTAALGRFAQGLGFEWFTYLSVQDPNIYGLSNYPDLWQREYLDRGLNLVDPVIQASASRHEAFTWSQWDLPVQPERQHLGFMAEARRVGIRSGITIPIREGFGRRALLTLAGRDDRPRRDVQLSAFTALSLAAFIDGTLRSRLRVPMNAAACPLTPAQIQCLSWMLQGKSNEDIAALRGSSRRAVEAHMQNIRERLGVATTYQAIAIAVQRGWVIP